MVPETHSNSRVYHEPNKDTLLLPPIPVLVAEPNLHWERLGDLDRTAPARQAANMLVGLRLEEALDLGHQALIARGARLAALDLTAAALLVGDDVRGTTTSVVDGALGLRDRGGTLNILRKASVTGVVVLRHVALSTATGGVCVRLDGRSDEVFGLGVRSVGIRSNVSFWRLATVHIFVIMRRRARF